MVYTPRPEGNLECLIEQSTFYYDRIKPGLGKKMAAKAKYDFTTYEGNLKALSDGLLFLGYKPDRMEVIPLSDGFSLEDVGNRMLDKTQMSNTVLISEAEGEDWLCVELRHPDTVRTEAMCIFQEWARDNYHEYHLVDSFPDFWEQYIERCRWKNDWGGPQLNNKSRKRRIGKRLDGKTWEPCHGSGYF